MNNVATLLVLCLICGGAIIIGSYRIDSFAATEKNDPVHAAIPYIGRIEVLNGCGIAGAANETADFLRRHHFDVKNIGNAQAWNYCSTLVVSRTENMTHARKVAEALSTGRVILLRNEQTDYDVTVFIGPDYKEIIQ
jgi:hypothetical protein